MIGPIIQVLSRAGVEDDEAKGAVALALEEGLVSYVMVGVSVDVVDGFEVGFEDFEDVDDTEIVRVVGSDDAFMADIDAFSKLLVQCS